MEHVRRRGNIQKRMQAEKDPCGGGKSVGRTTHGMRRPFEKEREVVASCGRMARGGVRKDEGRDKRGG